MLPVALLVLLRAAGRAPTPVQLGHRALSVPADVTLSPRGSRRRVRGVSEETKEKEEVVHAVHALCELLHRCLTQSSGCAPIVQWCAPRAGCGVFECLVFTMAFAVMRNDAHACGGPCCVQACGDRESEAYGGGAGVRFSPPEPVVVQDSECPLPLVGYAGYDNFG